MPTFRATIVLRIALAAVSISTMIPAGLVLFADASVPSWLAPMQLMVIAALAAELARRGPTAVWRRTRLIRGAEPSSSAS